MKNFVQPGDKIEFENDGTPRTSGTVVQIGAIFGVLEVDVAANESETALVRGVVELPKDANPHTQGALVDWDGSQIVASGGGTDIGHVWKTVIGGDATVQVRLLEP